MLLERNIHLRPFRSHVEWSWSDWLKQPLTPQYWQKYRLYIIGADLIKVFFDTFKNAKNFLSLNHSLQSILTAPGEICQEGFLHGKNANYTPMQHHTQACVVLGRLPVITWSHSGVCKGGSGHTRQWCPSCELHTQQECEWMSVRRPVHVICLVRLCAFCALWDLIKPLFLDPPLGFSTVDITRAAEIYYFYSKHDFSLSPADMKNRNLTIDLIRGVSFHSRIVSLKCLGSSERQAAANR